VTHRGWSIDAYRFVERPLIRWGEKLGAPRMSFIDSGTFAPVLSRTVRVVRLCVALQYSVSEGRSGSLGQTTSTARLKTGAEGLIQQTTPSTRRVLRPTAPLRHFAFSRHAST